MRLPSVAMNFLIDAPHEQHFHALMINLSDRLQYLTQWKFQSIKLFQERFPWLLLTIFSYLVES